MRASFIAVILAFLVCNAALIYPVVAVRAVPEGVLLFDEVVIQVKGELTYRYNCTEPGRSVFFWEPVWAHSFWSDVKVLGGVPSMFGEYVKEEDAYVETRRDDVDAVLMVQFNVGDLEPFQEVRVEIRLNYTVWRVDTSRIGPEQVGTVDEAREAVDGKYLEEAYYWDFSHPAVQRVIQEINASIGGSKNVYRIVYGALSWLSTHAYYIDRPDYPYLRLKASEILNNTISTPYGDRYYGVCRHFADLFVAIMRGFGVPCNLYYGLIFRDLGGSVGVIFVGGHAWCEVYMPNVGWVPVDVTITDRYTRDIVRVGLVSQIYYVPTYKEFTNTAPTPPTEAYEYLIPSYWSWSVESTGRPATHAATEEKLIERAAKLAQTILPWFLLLLVALLIADRYRLRKMIEEQNYPIVRTLKIKNFHTAISPNRTRSLNHLQIRHPFNANS